MEGANVLMIRQSCLRQEDRLARRLWVDLLECDAIV